MTVYTAPARSNVSLSTPFKFLVCLIATFSVLTACTSNSGKESRIGDNVDDISASRSTLKVGEEVTFSVFFSTRRFVEGDRRKVTLLVKLPESLEFKLGSDRIYGNGSQDATPTKIIDCSTTRDGSVIQYDFTDGELDRIGDDRSLLELRFIARATLRDPVAVVQSSANNSDEGSCTGNKRYEEFEELQINR